MGSLNGGEKLSSSVVPFSLKINATPFNNVTRCTMVPLIVWVSPSFLSGTNYKSFEPVAERGVGPFPRISSLLEILILELHHLFVEELVKEQKNVRHMWNIVGKSWGGNMLIC